MKRGEIWWATLIPRSGSEQTGTRPVLILSHDAFNQVSSWRSIMVAPLRMR
ncbi:MAG: type II toxin-antitoxin system PemK/MazF family toxin [Proteobacteria bacterium]|nr:type II toxin-antitoxin system PemK/MazF family toxin [Pseudomonadota bacterium]